LKTLQNKFDEIHMRCTPVFRTTATNSTLQIPTLDADLYLIILNSDDKTQKKQFK